MSLRTRTKTSDKPVEFIELQDSGNQTVAKPVVKRSGREMPAFHLFQQLLITYYQCL